MPRQLEFDENAALCAAMDAFRRLGYAGVSIKMLEAETGLSSGSIYNSFGSKDAVFERALEHYNSVVVQKRIRDHLGGKGPAEGLATLFESLLDEPEDGAFGCLLTNCAIEFPGSEAKAGTEIRRGFQLLLDAFSTALLSIPGATPDAANATSMRLLAYYQGLLVLIRHGYDKSMLRAAIRSEINCIAGALND